MSGAGPDGKAVVAALFDRWRRFDLDGAIALIADDAVFVPDPKTTPTVGREAISALWFTYMDRMKSYACDIHHVAVMGPIVFVERVERIETERRRMTLPIVGVFEIDAHGRIAAWRDYWDTPMAGTH